MKFFDFSWFSSPERKKLRELQVKEKELSIQLLEKKLTPPEGPVYKPYKKLIYSNGNITAVLAGGVVINKKGVDGNLFQQVKDAYSEDVIRRLLAPDVPVAPKQEGLYTKEEIEIVKNCVDVLKTNEDFEFTVENVFLKGVALPLVPVLLASFIELEEKMQHLSLKYTVHDGDSEELDELKEKYEALKMFWRWTALNPIESSRNDLLTFVKHNSISITNNGMLELYRRAVNVGNESKELVAFISEQYFKVKKAKKGPKNYNIVQDNDGTYQMRADNVGVILGCQKMIGNLQDLYLNLPTMSENIYTDNHTRTKIIRVGTVYKEDEDKIDLDNSRSCSSGIHAGSRSFIFDGFGDTGFLVLANPCKVRSVPNHESNKMRLSEVFIAGVVDFSSYEEGIDSGNLADYSQEYFNTSVEELETQLKNKTYDGLSCQDNVPVLSITNIQDITKALKSRVVSI